MSIEILNSTFRAQNYDIRQYSYTTIILGLYKGIIADFDKTVWSFVFSILFNAYNILIPEIIYLYVRCAFYLH